jgi:hypothetical protein
MRSERLAHITHELEQVVSQTVAGAGASERGRTLKVRCSSKNAFNAEQMQQIRTMFDTLVLLLEHVSADVMKEWIDAWKSECPGLKIRLAMPLFSREKERHGLKEAVRELISEGWTGWECADLAGWHFLTENGITAMTADWSLYAFNRVAVAELKRLGITSFVVSPECDLPNTCALAAAPLQAEVLIYQHVPLFISETPPCVEEVKAGEDLVFTDKRGNAFITQQCDRRWITTSSIPLDRFAEESDLPFSLKRVDLSWSPRGGRDSLKHV